MTLEHSGSHFEETQAPKALQPAYNSHTGFRRYAGTFPTPEEAEAILNGPDQNYARSLRVSLLAHEPDELVDEGLKKIHAKLVKADVIAKNND